MPSSAQVAADVRDCQMLSSHVADCVFRGIEAKPCFFRTSLCPTRCGHGAEVAVFDVVSYVSYEKLGEYGDEKSSSYYVTLEGGSASEAERVTSSVAALIRSLAPGRAARLKWAHNYVTVTSPDGTSCSAPERPLLDISVAH